MTGYQLKKKKDLFSECPKHKVEEGNTPPVCLQLHQRERGGLHLKKDEDILRSTW